MSKNTKQLIFRQGDVLVRKIDKKPANLEVEAKDQIGRVVLAHGEKTGHAHAIRGRGAYMAKNKAAGDTLVLERPAVLKHELISGAQAEHAPIELDAGNYEIAAQVNYTPKEIQRVAD